MDANPALVALLMGRHMRNWLADVARARGVAAVLTSHPSMMTWESGRPAEAFKTSCCFDIINDFLVMPRPLRGTPIAW